MMQQLFDAGIGIDPISGMAVFDPSACAPALLTALWRAYCGVADTINTKELGQTEEALAWSGRQLFATVRRLPPRGALQVAASTRRARPLATFPRDARHAASRASRRLAQPF